MPSDPNPVPPSTPYISTRSRCAMYNPNTWVEYIGRPPSSGSPVTGDEPLVVLHIDEFWSGHPRMDAPPAIPPGVVVEII